MRRPGLRGGIAVLSCLACFAFAIPGALALDQTFTVNSQNDANDGTCDATHCSFREAINAANGAAGHDTIVFDIPGTGVHSIIPSSALPLISSPVTINATTEPGYSGTPLIEVRGLGLPGATGLFFVVGTGASEVRGLALTSWEGSGVVTQASTTVTLLGNYLGMSPDGVTARPNLTGVTFLGGSDHVVGGPGEGQGNLISGNTQAGVRVQDVDVMTIHGNRIGTNAAGTAARANSVGIEIFPTSANASEVTIGGDNAGEGNLVSGNTTEGIRFSPSSGRAVIDTTILGNRIGTNAAGTGALANGENGIEISGGAGVVGPTTSTQIGRTGPNEGNTIAFNGQDGVHVASNGPAPENTGASIRGNSIHSNGGLGIDLAPNGVTANDPPANLDADGGPNDLQNFPLLGPMVGSTINGELDAAANQGYSIDVYWSPSCDASTNGEGEVHVAELLEATTDASGHLGFSTSPTLPSPGGVVTATATNSNGSTSEFSPCLQVPDGPQPGPTFTVNTVSDTPADAGCSSAECTLREAIEAANGQVGSNSIVLDPPGSGIRTITPATPLPTITDPVDVSADASDLDVDGLPLLRLDGSTFGSVGAAIDGLVFDVPGTTASSLTGLAFTQWTRGNASGLRITGSGPVTVTRTLVGTDQTGASGLGNYNGIAVTNDSTIGGFGLAADRNVLSGNTTNGITVSGPATVVGNYIGVALDGVTPLPNGFRGVYVTVSNAVIGGTTLGAGNVISGNIGPGVVVDNAGATGVRIQGNSIFGNTGPNGLGIDLGNQFGPFGGVSLNDPPANLDADAGPNNLQNFPEVTSATPTEVDGVLDSAASQTFTIDLYSSSACDPSGYGEGANHLASFDVSTNSSGHAAFTHALALSPGVEVTATATDTGGNTSEFSQCVAVAISENTYVVDTNADGAPDGCAPGGCTLREAILAANGDGTASTIEFDLADTDIVLGSELPTITAPVTIDGTSQGPGTVSISGDAAGDARGIVLGTGSGGSFVEELWLHSFSSGAAFQVESDGSTLQGSQIWSVGTGVLITNGASGNTIGGSFAGGAGNRIWNFAGDAIRLDTAGSANLIQGNTIGIDDTDTPQTLTPGSNGIFAASATGTVIGHNVGPDGLGLVDGDLGNVIVRAGTGIFFESDVTGSVLAGNFVGVDRAGVATDLGAGGNGLEISSSDGNQIGPGNHIAHNGVLGNPVQQHGVRIDHSSGDRIVANSIHSNAGKGISLNSSNQTAPTPTLAATTFGAQTRLDVSVTGAPPGASYFMELFTNSTCTPDGEGEVFGGFVTFTPDANGEQAVYAGALAPGTLLTVTLTNASTADTSEFSNCATVADGANAQGGPTFTVNVGGDPLSPSDAGCTVVECTLREAIVAANDAPGLNTIIFDFPGVQIGLNAALPAVTNPAVIDASSQLSGVQINGSDTIGADGLVLAAGSGGSTIRHLEFRFFDGPGESAIRVQSSGNTVRDNFIHDVFAGVVVSGVAASNNVVGGSFGGGEGNSIWGFTQYGVRFEGAGDANRVSGNTIGVDPDGQPDAAGSGISVGNTSGTVIGADVGPGDSPNPDLGNVVVGVSGGFAVTLIGAGTTATKVTSNFVGVDRVSAGLGNGAGIGIAIAAGNQLGPGNTIATNDDVGIAVGGDGATGNRITRNSIFDNGGLGIDLAGAGNNGLAAPLLISATEDADSTTVAGEHNGTVGRDYRVEVFSNATCDGSGSGEGETFLVGFTFTATQEFQNFSTDIEGVFPGDVITATVTDLSTNDTSEFSNCVTISASAPPPAPVLFGAVRDATPGTLGVAGLVDSGQPGAGQAFDLEFFSVPACDPVAPKTSLGVGPNFLTNEAGIAGFAKDGLTNVPIGTFVVATATRSGVVSALSNCVVADRNNTSWHTAFELTPTDTEQGALRALGEGRWFKVPILPNSRVEVSLTDLPADYDLVVFSDIQQAYDRLVGTNVDPAVGPNLAITDLQRAGAETQNDVFNTSQYDATSWEPTNWDPSLNTALFSPSQWSPSQWSPSQWSATQWSPSQWSPSQWSPSQWSPSQWSPSQWSPSQWSPSQWSPSQWSSSNPNDPRAFSAAQTASLLAVSAGPGTGDENVAVNTWNNTGYFYFRVQGKNGAFDPGNQFSLSVTRQGSLCAGIVDQASTPVAPTGLGAPKTLVLTDSRRLDLTTITPRLNTLVARPDVQGTVVNVDSDLTVRSLNQQADQKASCPFAKNLVASAIKRIVAAYRKRYPSIKYLVVVGDDNVIPFFRYPDPALMGNETLYVPPVRDDTASQASLRLGFILSDDFLASSTSIALHGTQFPVPDLSSGRLVETPQEIAGMLDAYLGTSNGVVQPTSSLTTGYDFLTDAADEIAAHLSAGIGGTQNRTLITDQTVSPATTTAPNSPPTRSQSWTANDLRNALLGPQRNDLIFLAGHFSANDALAADYKTNILTTELPAASTNMVNSIVFSAGCHTGYNIVNGHATTWTQPLDWAQAFAQKRATLISGTGYQYGDTDFLAHAERIYEEFARQLRITTQVNGAPEAVAVGHALLRSKQRFLELTPGLTALDEKSLLQTTLFGLPMLSVNLPQGRIVETPSQSIVNATAPVGSGPGQALGLRFANVDDLGAALTPRQKALTNLAVPATWLEGPDGVAVRPTQPILPLRSVDVTAPDPSTALRGVGFRGGSYVDTGGTTPLTAAPATELRGIHAPFFSDVFFPTQPWTLSYFGALAGGPTFLHLTPVQHRSESPTMTRRVFDGVDLRLFYSGNVTSYCPNTTPLQPSPCAPTQFGPVAAVTPALAAPPTITDVETSFSDGELSLRARVVGDPFAGIQSVWATWTIPPGLGNVGTWQSVDLVRDGTDSTLWTGTLQLGQGVDPGDVRFVVQAVNGIGRVTIDHNVGAFYRPGSIPGAGVPPGAPPPATTALSFTTPPPASVTYGDAFNVTVRLLSGGAAVAGKLVEIGIGPNGLPAVTGADGRATVQLQAGVKPGPYTVAASFSGDATHAPSDASAPTTIAARSTTLTLGGSFLAPPNSVHTILTAAPSTPLHQRSVVVVFRGTGPANVGFTNVFTGKTDPTGRVDVTSAFLASLPAGNYKIDAYFNGVNLPGIIVLAPDSPEYTPSTATANLVFRPGAIGMLDQAIALLNPLAALPGNPGGKARDTRAKVVAAKSFLDRAQPDRVNALSELVDGAAILETAVKTKLLTAAQTKPIFDLMTGAAWVVALEARDLAIARGGNPSRIAEANAAINQGNTNWAAGRYKDAISSFKTAVVKAQSA
jgi:CSLREA domain-containing protein